MIEITPIYAGLTGVLMAALSIRVGLLRGKHQVGLGDGGHADLALGIRRFGNLSEYAPMIMILMLLMEIKGTDTTVLHIYGTVFIILRLIHPVILFSDMPSPMWKKTGRFISAGGTALLMIFSSYFLLTT